MSGPLKSKHTRANLLAKLYMKQDLHFRREERLKSEKTIARLFKEGQSFAVFPLRVVWLPLEAPVGTFPVQMALTVSKKKFPKAVDRNQVRRKVREAYRLHKAELYKALSVLPDHPPIALMILYGGNLDLPFGQIERSMAKLLHRLGKMLQSGMGQPTPPKE